MLSTSKLRTRCPVCGGYGITLRDITITGTLGSSQPLIVKCRTCTTLSYKVVVSRVSSTPSSSTPVPSSGIPLDPTLLLPVVRLPDDQD
jgi:hypothetical protein